MTSLIHKDLERLLYLVYNNNKDLDYNTTEEFESLILKISSILNKNRCQHKKFYRNYIYDQSKCHIVPKVDVCINCNRVLGCKE